MCTCFMWTKTITMLKKNGHQNVLDLDRSKYKWGGIADPFRTEMARWFGNRTELIEIQDPRSRSQRDDGRQNIF